MPTSAFHEESAPAEPSSTLLGLEGWPQLRFHYVFRSDVARGGLRFEVAMTFAPPPPLSPKPAEEAPGPSDTATADVAASDDDPRAALLERYRTIAAQWETENEVTLDATICVGSLQSAGPESAAACLRSNVRAIVAALEAGGATEAIVAPELAPLVFTLPDPEATPTGYVSDVLQTLAVTLRFRRPKEAKPAAAGTATASADAAPPPPAILTRVPPLPDDGADASPSYRTLATALEATYTGFGWRVVQAEGSDDDEERELALVRWQVSGGLQFTLSEPSAGEQAGFACPRLSPVLLTRAAISTALLPSDFPTRYAQEEQRMVAEFDLDAELARFLDDVEVFLAPERRVRTAFFESGLVKRGLAAKEALVDLLAARVAAISADAPGTEARDAAREALRAAGCADLRHLDRIGAVALWRLEIAAPLPLVVHGKFVPAQTTQPAVLGGSVRLTATSNPLALAICARGEDGSDRVELSGAFRCEAIARVNEADGREGARLRFVTEADTSVAAPLLRARLPWRVLPLPPRELAHVAVFDPDNTVAAAKRWWIRCDYACEPAPVDVLQWGVEFGATPAARGAAGGARPDLLDTLVVSRLKLPGVAEELSRSLPSLARAITVRADAPVREAIRAFVQLMEWVVAHFVLPPEAREPSTILPLSAGAPPPAAGSVTSEIFNIARCAAARVAVQIVRNTDDALAPVFRYASRIARPPEELCLFAERELSIDITGLPPLDDFMPGDPSPGSLADGLTRLLSEVVSAPGPKAGAPVVALAMQVAFAYRLTGSGVGLPEVRVPVLLFPPEAFPSDRRPDATRRRAQQIAGGLEEWRESQNPPALHDARSGARFVFDLTLFMIDAPSAEERPVLRLSELYFRCAPA